ncbi:hypothetical protein QBC38DRAFT_46433 [Podospora fimiseda]|uniref:Nephrocystin 3-like N-terminal domain-containing protein n=1 Tax=Podospora fimiseda TaxID=252190 RepID=A0AAN7GSI3_9PEZI|nr:hypothetical protein QBC38DRAFT_46433 [Podospora fimiseda]
MDDQRPRIEAWLRSLAGPDDHPRRFTENLRILHPGSMEWLLESDDFTRWADNPGLALFCYGMAASGKSVLTASIVNELQKRHETDSTVGIAYVYITYSLAEYSKYARQLLCSILLQFSLRRQPLPEALTSLYADMTHHGREPRVEEIVQTIISTGRSYTKAFIIIDGLDQLGLDTQFDFPLAIATLHTKLRANIFATSRNESDFSYLLKNRDSTNSITLQMLTEESKLRDYVEEELRNLTHNKPGLLKKELQQQIIDQIVAHARGNFLIASQLIKILKSKSADPEQFVTMLQYPPQRLPRASNYHLNLDRIFDTTVERINSHPPKARELIFKAFLWTINVRKPLTTQALLHAITVDIGDKELDQYGLPRVEDVISLSLGLLTAQNDRVLCHRMIAKYLKEQVDKFFVDPDRLISDTCITYLNFEKLQSAPCVTKPQFEDQCRDYPLYNYAAKNWGHHARKASGVSPLTVEFLKSPRQPAVNFQAIQFSDDKEITELRGVTGLHLAAYFGLVDAVAQILEQKVFEAMVTDSLGRTPLWWAAKYGNELIAKVLLPHDTCTWHYMVRNGENGLARFILDAGQDVNMMDFWKLTALHVSAENTNAELAAILIAANAETETQDIHGITPLQKALNQLGLCGHGSPEFEIRRNFVDVLLKACPDTAKISVDGWRTAFSKHDSKTSTLVLSTNQHENGLVLRFTSGTPQYLLSIDENTERSLFHLDMSAWKWQEALQGGTRMPTEFKLKLGSNPNSQGDHFQIFLLEVDQEHWRYFISAAAQLADTNDTRKTTLWWNVMRDKSNNVDRWISRQHISNMSRVWIPKDGIDFFQRFIQELQERWLETCQSKQDELEHLRNTILETHKKKEDMNITSSLLQIGKDTIRFRNILQLQGEKAKLFSEEYHRKHGGVSSLKDLEGSIDNFTKATSQELNKLDEVSKDLLQMEFNLISIYEARKSTDLSSSMARLSWITFIFLPLTFISGLFGMNVDILESNPPWWWYFPFAGGIMTITFFAWMVSRWGMANDRLLGKKDLIG